MYSRGLSLLSLVLAFAHLAILAPFTSTKDKRSFVEQDGVNYTLFEHAATGARVEFVTNSGICETTAGVNQYSGYLSVGDNMNMWFWFFEARSNPATAPLAAWFNGGPGCSSMIGLFQENGPCHFVNDSSDPSLNPYSFNNNANMLYIDQPIGAGFSYGADPVTSSTTAAPYAWKLLQAFYAQFPQYESRDFGIFTESYGGHYGPEFAYYIERQNAAIQSGSLTGERINIVALGINNGWYDPALQYQAYIKFAYKNTYRQLMSGSQFVPYMDAYIDDCLPALELCANSDTDEACASARIVCDNGIYRPLSQAVGFNVYDIRQLSTDTNPPSMEIAYLRDPAVMEAIGAKTMYQQCADAPYYAFLPSGDGAFPISLTVLHLTLALTSLLANTFI